nr:replication factor A protein 1-like [Ipomoea batatas]
MERKGSTEIKSKEIVFHDEQKDNHYVLVLHRHIVDNVSKVEPFYKSDFTDPIVVLLQFYRVKNGIRDGEVKLCSSYVVTQGFLSDEADSSVATLGITIPHEGIEGPVKMSLVDEFSSTKELKKISEGVVKVEI